MSIQLLASQLLLGLINGSFYAMLSMGLAIIFGLMNVVNFAHGAQYMIGAFIAWLLLTTFGLPYWGPDRRALGGRDAGGCHGTAAAASLAEPRSSLRPACHLCGCADRRGPRAPALWGNRHPYANPFPGGVSLGFMFVPYYRLWVVAFSLVTCFGTWYLIEHTKLGAYLRAANENPDIVETFGINVPKMITLTYGFGAGLAALSGVLAAPIYQVSPSMGSSVMIVVFAIVVIGGMGSILGAIFTGYLLGLVEGLTKVFYPEAATVVVFVFMMAALLFRPAGVFQSSHRG